MKGEKPQMPELTRVSSKGQVVIPKDIRSRLHIREGGVFAVSAIDGDMVIMKKVEDPMAKEDLEIAMEVRKAWEEIERGEFRESSVEEFKKKLEKL